MAKDKKDREAYLAEQEQARKALELAKQQSAADALVRQTKQNFRAIKEPESSQRGGIEYYLMGNFNEWMPLKMSCEFVQESFSAFSTMLSANKASTKKQKDGKDSARQDESQGSDAREGALRR